MWTGVVPLEELNAAGRWTVAFFSTVTNSQASVYPMKSLRELVTESKSAVDPQGLTAESINYLGLENVRSMTGELVEFEPRHPSQVKSRSKTYCEGDVLFGRLRPELNKVYLAEPHVSPGICSNEFIVLTARADLIHPRYLRYALASPYVADFANKLRTGASLPRMNSGDLLDLAIPVPPLDVQERLAGALLRLDGVLRSLRIKVETLPSSITDALSESLRTGSNELVPICEALSELPE